jgi:heat shock protein HslJ
MLRFRNVLSFALASVLFGCASTDSGGPVLQGSISAPPPAIAAPGDALLTGTPWAWQSTKMSDGTRIVPDVPERYTITFRPGGEFAVRADCNHGTGRYLLNDTALSFGPIALTKMMCPPGSRDAEFLKELAAVSSQNFTGNELELMLSGHAGTMHFMTPRQ